MLWIVEKGVRGEICHGIHWYLEADKCMKVYDNKELFYLLYWDVNDFYGWAISQNLPVSGYSMLWRFHQKLQGR